MSLSPSELSAILPDWAGLSLDVEDHRAMRLAGVLHNASYSVMRLRPDQLRLHTFNSIPHLTHPELHTYR